MAGFLKGLEDHFASINNFLSLASKDNENGNLVTCIRVQTSWFSFELRRNCFPPGASQLALVAKCLPASAGDTQMQLQSLGREDPLDKDMATHSSLLAWRIPWTDEPGGLQSTGCQRAGHD